MTRIKRDFLVFHGRNPVLWHWIDHFALMRVRNGWKNYAIAGIIERARWETAIPTESEDVFKINNNHKAHYSRMWMLAHPQYTGFFRTRHILDDDLPDRDDYGPLNGKVAP